MNEELLIRLVNAQESIAKSLVSLAEETRADKDLKNKLYEATTQMESNVSKITMPWNYPEASSIEGGITKTVNQ